MKKSTVFVGALFLSILLSAPAAFPWGWTVHTYIDEQFATKWHLQNANQVYGGLAPDLFNFRFDAPDLRDYMQNRTHNDFMPVWNAAKSKPAKALAFGFVSHNEVWGVDSTAHRVGLTYGQAGTIPGHPNAGGYVIAKAYELMGVLNQLPQFAALNLPEPVVLTVTHELVERGVDLLMKELDPMIGAKMAAAALPPNPNFPLLMEKAYAADLATHFGISRIEAVKFLVSSERQFRQTMILYGHVLMQDDATAIALMAEQLEEMAKAFLAAVGLPPLPDGLDIKPLLQYGIMQAMLRCGSDFALEVAATAEFVEQQLHAHGISYGVPGR
jgi:hypothetical protein